MSTHLRNIFRNGISLRKMLNRMQCEGCCVALGSHAMIVDVLKLNALVA